MLVADLRPAIAPLPALRIALVAAVGLVAALFAAMLGPRADLWAATTTSGFLFEIAVTGTLSVNAYRALQGCAFPHPDGCRTWPAILPATLLLLSGLGFEMALVSSDVWMEQAMGQNAALHVSRIVLIGLPLLAAFVAALRHGAPSSPGATGMLAGVLSGALVTTFYAIHSSEDSPLFFATWYSLAIVLLAAAGAVAGGFLLKW